MCFLRTCENDFHGRKRAPKPSQTEPLANRQADKVNDRFSESDKGSAEAKAGWVELLAMSHCCLNQGTVWLGVHGS